MSIRFWSKAEVLQPRGAWTSKALLSKNVPSRASIAQNVRFSPDYCYSREGTSNISIGSFNTSAGKVGGMYNWISPTDNFLIYLDGSNIKKLKLSDGTVSTLQAIGGSPKYPSIADLGPRVYFAAANSSGDGQTLPYVHDGASATTQCFRGPLATTAFSAFNGAGGLCTIGTHRLGFLFQSAMGFIGQPCPVNSGVFAYASTTLASNNLQVSIQLTMNTPADAGTGSLLIPIMTRADNLSNWFIVPSSACAVSGTVGYPVPPASTNGYAVQIDINISDEDLAGADSALDNFNYLVSGGVGTDTPPSPDFVVAYGKRMCYGAGIHLYVSEVNNPQAITSDFNVVSNPSQRRIRAAFPLGDQLFVSGDRWTGRTRDTGDVPSTWPSPATVSDAIGAPFQNCVEFHTAGSYVWIASEAGVFVFDGMYPQRPVTYLCSDLWKRVNWSAASSIQITDDTVNLKCYVAVPLDSATDISHVFTIDYTNGYTWNTCDISLDNFGFGNFASIRVVKEASTRTVVWIGPTAANPLIHLDTSQHRDAGNTIVHSLWESGYCRRSGEQQTSMIRLGAAHIWAKGSGTLLVTWFGRDRVASVQPILESTGATAGQVPLSASPGLEYYVKGDLPHVENYTIRFETNALDDFFQLVGFTAYTKKDLANR